MCFLTNISHRMRAIILLKCMYCVSVIRNVDAAVLCKVCEIAYCSEKCKQDHSTNHLIVCDTDHHVRTQKIFRHLMHDRIHVVHAVPRMSWGNQRMGSHNFFVESGFGYASVKETCAHCGVIITKHDYIKVTNILRILVCSYCVNVPYCPNTYLPAAKCKQFSKRILLVSMVCNKFVNTDVKNYILILLQLEYCPSCIV